MNLADNESKSFPSLWASVLYCLGFFTLVICLFALLSQPVSATGIKAREADNILNVGISMDVYAHTSIENATVKDLNAQGIKAYLSKDMKTAENAFAQALAQAKKDSVDGADMATVLTNLGACQRDQGDLADAESNLKKALEVISKNKNNQEKIRYIARQYAALLRKQGFENQAEILDEDPGVALSLIQSQENAPADNESSNKEGDNENFTKEDNSWLQEEQPGLDQSSGNNSPLQGFVISDFPKKADSQPVTMTENDRIFYTMALLPEDQSFDHSYNYSGTLIYNPNVQNKLVDFNQVSPDKYYYGSIEIKLSCPTWQYSPTFTSRSCIFGERASVNYKGRCPPDSVAGLYKVFAQTENGKPIVVEENASKWLDVELSRWSELFVQ